MSRLERVRLRALASANAAITRRDDSALVASICLAAAFLLSGLAARSPRIALSLIRSIRRIRVRRR